MSTSDQGNKDDVPVNEALEESFPASDPAARATPHREDQMSAIQGDKITVSTWIMVAVAVILFIGLVTMHYW